MNIIKKSMNAINRKKSKIYIDGIKFDSQAEADFYSRYVKNCGYKYDIHPKFELLKKDSMGHGIMLSGINYYPDFVIYNSDGSIKHVYDNKPDFSIYTITPGIKLKFRLFYEKYGYPVEGTICRKKFFWRKIFGTTRKFDKVKETDFDYDYWERES